jgi:hypothetical protein
MNYFVGGAAARVTALALGLVLAGGACAADRAPAQERRALEAHAFRTPHLVFDDRYRHNRYYPAPGYRVTVLPHGYFSLNFGSRRLFFHAGVWYEAVPPGYIVVRPPAGVLLPAPPPAYTVIWVNGIAHYYANDIYYAPAPGGFIVVPPPPAARSAAPAVDYYYCESAEGYYPYVRECPEGWRTVPATPPGS